MTSSDRTVKILAVDDNPINVDLIVDIIEAGGWQVIPAFDGPSAIKIAHTELPDLIILDVNMPGMSGFDVCRTLKSDPETGNIPIIMLTALGQVEDRVKGLDVGADDYLTKPYSARELIARIETRLRAKSESDALRQQQQAVRDAFERFVHPSVVNRLLQDPAHVKLGGQMREITVMFADLENFTTISEMTSPEELLNVLNAYHKLVVEIVMEQGGTIDKFIGDAVMVLYNTPLEQQDHAARAVRSAILIQEAVHVFHQNLEPHFRMNINIGIHSGLAVVGNVGAPQIMDYTAVGDTVNIAARLQGWSKGGQVLVSEDVYRLTESLFDFSAMGAMTLKGRSKTVVTFAVNGVVNGAVHGADNGPTKGEN